MTQEEELALMRVLGAEITKHTVGTSCGVALVVAFQSNRVHAISNVEAALMYNFLREYLASVEAKEKELRS